MSYFLLLLGFMLLFGGNNKRGHQGDTPGVILILIAILSIVIGG